MTPRVVLVGLPGTGKSATGRRLAKILAVDFADSDELIERATARSVPAIFAEEGESVFRRVEAEVVADALGGFDGVLALGGGALTTPETRRALRESRVLVVLLTAPMDTLLARVGDGRTRPLLSGDPARRLATLDQERGPAFRAAATLTVQTENRTPGQVASRIAARLQKRASHRR